MSHPYSLDGTLTPERLAQLKRGGSSVDQEAGRLVESAGLSAPRADAVRYRPGVLHANPYKVSPRWPYAVMRIKRILEGAAKVSSIEGAVRGAEHAKLAQEYVEAWTYYMTRSKPPPLKGADHNPFRFMSDVDAAKKFMRLVEDICDRSTGRLGAWYVR